MGIVENFKLGFALGSTKGKKGNMGGLAKYAIAAVVGLTVLTALAGTIFGNLSALRTNGNLTTGEAALMGVVGLGFVIGIVYAVFKSAGVSW